MFGNRSLISIKNHPEEGQEPEEPRCQEHGHRRYTRSPARGGRCRAAYHGAAASSEPRCLRHLMLASGVVSSSMRADTSAANASSSRRVRYLLVSSRRGLQSPTNGREGRGQTYQAGPRRFHPPRRAISVSISRIPPITNSLRAMVIALPKTTAGSATYIEFASALSGAA